MTLRQRADNLGCAMDLVLEVAADPELSHATWRSLGHLEGIVQLVYDRFRRDAAGTTDERSVGTTRGGCAAGSARAAASRPLAAAPPSHQEIARAAFASWQSQGGGAEQNWLRCERQLNDRRLVLG